VVVRPEEHWRHRSTVRYHRGSSSHRRCGSQLGLGGGGGRRGGGADLFTGVIGASFNGQR
jgi:hypothetical protein